ncbi:MAG: TonB-dependent receptor, partial [Bacteroidetes bacterium]|nr:TonB-dependent receptor [Bacteroidota bacterium]
MSRSIAFLLLLLPLYAFSLSAQDAALRGVVRDVTDRPVPGAHVYLVDRQAGTTTDGRGRFFLSGLQEGSVRVRFSHIGYALAERVLVLRNGEKAELAVTLEERVLDLGDVTVTGTRYSALQRETPLPVTVIGTEHLVRQIPISVPDALDAEPGIALVRDGMWGTDINIRGLSRSNVVTLMDGARIETATSLAAGLSLIDGTDIDRIEVIRGGASSLYGTGATGGVVNIISRDAPYADALRLSGGFNSSYSGVNNGSAAALTLDAADDRWSIHLHGGMRSAGDARTPDGVLRDSRFHDRSLHVSAGFRPTETQELRVRYQQFDATDVGIPGGATFPESASARYADAHRSLAMAEYATGALSTHWQDASIRVFRQFIRRNVELHPNAAVSLRPSADHEMYGVQAQTVWRFAAHQFTGGVDGWQRSYSGLREREVHATNTVIADLPLPDARFRSIGAYVQDDVEIIAERLRLSMGGRIDHIHVGNDEAYDLQYIESNGTRNTAPPNRTLRWNAEEADELSWSAHAGLRWHMTSSLDLTANMARAFRAPSLEERYQFIELGGATYIGDVDLAAEKGAFLDAGLHFRHADVVVHATAFLRFMNDLVIDARVSDTLYQKANVGEARIFGAELSGEWRLFHTVVGYASASLVRGEDSGTGTDLPQMPPVRGRAGIRIPLAS